MANELRSDPQQVLNGSFREWMLEIEAHMERCMANSEEPSLKFEVCGVIYEINLLDWPGLYTKQD